MRKLAGDTFLKNKTKERNNISTITTTTTTTTKKEAFQKKKASAVKLNQKEKN